MARSQDVWKPRKDSQVQERKGRKPDIVMFSTTSWYFLRQRPEQLALRLAKDRKVLYVEPFENLEILDRISNLRNVGNVHIYKPPDLTRIPLLGKCMSVFLGRINVSLLISDLRFLCKEMNLYRPVLITLNPFSDRLVGSINQSLTIYDCVDDWPSFKRYHKVWEKEKRLVKKCDAILATSHRILERRKAHAKVSYLVPNAADFEHFQRTLSSDISTASEIATMKKPIIGYVGAVFRWVDFDLIDYIAKKNPSWNIVLVGPTEPDYPPSVEGPNIHFLGKRPYEQLPSYLRGIDVCIIPFEVNEITLSVDPIKIYEYLAAGKPVVSTFLPELQKFGDRVRIAKNREDFENQIREALREDGALVSKRIDLARSNTWEERARRISQIIDELLIAKRGTAG